MNELKDRKPFVQYGKNPLGFFGTVQNKIFCWGNEENFFIKNPILSRKNLIYFRFFLFYEEGRRFNTNWIKHKVLALLSHNWFHCFVFLKLCSSMIPLCVNKSRTGNTHFPFWRERAE